MPFMQVNLSQPLNTLHGEVMQRPTLAYLKAVARFQILHGKDYLEKIAPEERQSLLTGHEVPMTLGYLVCESLPKSLPQNASEADKTRIAALQRRVVKEGVQEFTNKELETMIEGLFAYVAPDYSFLAHEAAGYLTPGENPSPSAS